MVRFEANAGVLPGPVAVYYFIYQMEECMSNCMNKFWVATSVLGDIAEVLARVSFCSSVKKHKRKTVLSQHLEASWLEHSVFCDDEDGALTSAPAEPVGREGLPTEWRQRE